MSPNTTGDLVFKREMHTENYFLFDQLIKKEIMLS